MAKHDSVHINFCRLPQQFSYLLLFNSLLQILKFSDPGYEFFGLAFWSPLPKEGTKNFGAFFFMLGFAFATLGPTLFGSRAETERKKRLGPRFLNFGA
jgi:hypothetical protein